MAFNVNSVMVINNSQRLSLVDYADRFSRPSYSARLRPTDAAAHSNNAEEEKEAEVVKQKAKSAVSSAVTPRGRSKFVFELSII